MSCPPSFSLLGVPLSVAMVQVLAIEPSGSVEALTGRRAVSTLWCDYDEDVGVHWCSWKGCRSCWGSVVIGALSSEEDLVPAF